HRDGAGGQVDDARAAEGDDDAEGDARDQGPRPEAEDRKKGDLLPVHVPESLPWEAGPPSRPRLTREEVVLVELEGRRRPEEAGDALELPGAQVLEELRLVVARRRLGRVLPALEARRAERLRPAEVADRSREPRGGQVPDP